MTASHEQLTDLDRRWTEAEVDGDATTLDGLATDDFTLVGPAGFVLGKQQWLDRYRDGNRDLRMHSLRFEEDGHARLWRHGGDDRSLDPGGRVSRASGQRRVPRHPPRCA